MDFDRLIDNLNGPAEVDRQYAAEDLGAANSTSAVAALVCRLSVESSRAVKEAIFRALGQIRDNSVVPTAITLLAADDTFVRNEAVQLLSARGTEAVPALVRAIGGDDPDVRKFALDAMATIDSDLKDEVYRKLLGDADINLVITAVEYVGRDNKTALRQNVEAVLEQAVHPMLVAACVGTLGQIGNANSIFPMYNKLGGEGMSEFQVSGFIRAVGNLGTDAHVGMLCWLIERFPATLVDAGLDAIEAIHARVTLPQAPPALLAAVRSIVANCPDSLGRYKAVQALGAFTDEAACASVRQYLESHDMIARIAAVETIAQWGGPVVEELLGERALVEKDRDVLAAIQDAIDKQMRTAA